MQKVLLPVDGSEPSVAAVQHALDLIERDSTFVIVHVMDPQEVLKGLRRAAYSPDISAGALEERRASAREYIRQASDLVTEAGFTVAGEVLLEGRPGDSIARYAQEGEFDLVVMGTRGRSGVVRTLMGSVAEHVVRNLRGVPVLLYSP